MKYKKWAAYFGMAFMLTITGCGKDNAKVLDKVRVLQNWVESVNTPCIEAVEKAVALYMAE